MRSQTFLAVLFFQAYFAFAGTPQIYSQNGVNSSGNGGVHTIQGRLFLPSGRNADAAILVTLESTNFASLTVYTDQNGGFVFRSLTPGNYTVVADAGENFEQAREFVTIDTEVRGRVRIGGSPKSVRLPIHLQPKRGEVYKTGVINAKWAGLPREAVESYERGLELIEQNRNEDAIAHFRKAAELVPSFAPAHLALGKIFLITGKLDAAAASLRTALRYEPQDFETRLSLGIALMNKKEYENAETEFVTAAYLNKSAVTPHYYLGVIYIEKQNLDIAQKAMETAKALKGGKEFPLLHKYLGGIYMAKHIHRQAIEELETYIRLVPKASDADRIRLTIADLKSKQN